MAKKYKVYAAFITYANRAHLLEKAVKGCYSAGVEKIIIVDNNSDDESQKIMRRMEQRYGNNLEIVRLKENKGAAGGFKKCLEIVMKKKDCDLVWLMDDDCIPEKNSLKELLSFWDKQKLDRKELKPALFSLRFSLPGYMYMTDKELELKNLEKGLLNLNSFCFFSISRALSLIFKSRKRNEKKRAFKREYVQTVIAPFGSLLFEKSLIKEVGFPNEKFFTYFSDTEYTYRMYKKHGVSFFLVPSSKVKDIDSTFRHGYIRTYFSFRKIMENFHIISENKMYYEYRNRVAFEKQLLVTNRLEYQLNKLIFLCIIRPVVSLTYWLTYKDNKMKVFSRAIRDGTHMKF